MIHVTYQLNGWVHRQSFTFYDFQMWKRMTPNATIVAVAADKPARGDVLKGGCK